MERFTDEALVLSRFDYGEADRLVTLLTRAHGRLTAFAGMARKSKRRFAGALEVGTWLNARLVERQGTTLRLDEVEVLCSYHQLRCELPRIAQAFYCLELCRELTRDREPHEALFETLRAHLTALDAKQPNLHMLLQFQLNALRHTGLQPCFVRCALCGGQPGNTPRFASEHGGVVCAGCTPRLRHSLPVRLDLVDALARVQSGDHSALPVGLHDKAKKLLTSFITHHLGRLKSADFMEDVYTTASQY